MGQDQEAKRFIRLAQDWGISKKLVSQILIAGVYNTLGRASAVLGQHQRTFEHFSRSVELGCPEADSYLTTKARVNLQVDQLSLPPLNLDYENTKNSGRLNNQLRSNIQFSGSTTCSGRFSGVVITGDLLRASWDGKKLSQTHNIRWLYSILSTQISGLYPSDNREGGAVQENSGDITLSKMVFESEGQPFSEEGWANLYHKFPGARISELLDRLYTIKRGELAIGFELSSIVKNYFESKDIVYIDVKIGKYRYFDDLPLAFSSNDPDISSVLHSYQMSEQLIQWNTRCEKISRSRNSIPIQGKALVYFGQCAKDSSLIIENGFDSYLNYTNQIVNAAQTWPHCYYKHHPYEVSEEAEKFFLNAGFAITNENAYDLLSSDQVASVMGITTTLLHEAFLFGKRIERLGQNDTYLGTIHIQDAFLSADFWSQILRLRPTERSFDAPSKPNLVRSTIGAYWGK